MKKRILHANKFFELVWEQDLATGLDYQFLEFHRPGVRILVQNEQKEILLVRQYRHPIGKNTWELPAGGVDEGENALTAAKRELHEETGWAADSWVDLGSMVSLPNITNFQASLFYATQLSRLPSLPVSAATVEVQETRFYSLNEISKLILDGELRDDKTLAALQILSVSDVSFRI